MLQYSSSKYLQEKGNIQLHFTFYHRRKFGKLNIINQVDILGQWFNSSELGERPCVLWCEVQYSTGTQQVGTGVEASKHSGSVPLNIPTKGMDYTRYWHPFYPEVHRLSQ